MTIKNIVIFTIVATVLTVSAGQLFSQHSADPASSSGTVTPEQLDRWEQQRQQMIQEGIAFLRLSQGEDGSFSPSPRSGIGPTIIVLIGFLRNGVPADDPWLVSGLEYLLKSVQPDGGIYSPGGRISSYESCLALLCLHLAKKARGDNHYDKIIADAEKFIRSQQYSEENGTNKENINYGGLGYGGQTRPDLSNTQFFVETLNEMGYGPEDEAIQRALVFVSRCQNLESESNPTATAAKNPDGGFFYTCASEEENPAGTVNGGLRSYGSITYAGLKSLIYAGLGPDDPRVKAASGWIRDNYSVTENPGLGRRGLFYYYHTMSKTLDVLKNDWFLDKEGKKHYWKGELIDTLRKGQEEDGSWVNDNRAWMETDPNLVTGYVLIVLANCGKR